MRPFNRPSQRPACGHPQHRLDTEHQSSSPPAPEGMQIEPTQTGWVVPPPDRATRRGPVVLHAGRPGAGAGVGEEKPKPRPAVPPRMATRGSCNRARLPSAIRAIPPAACAAQSDERRGRQEEARVPVR